eukprot:1254917-Pleurochrysis_carterae.AAC.7
MGARGLGVLGSAWPEDGRGSAGGRRAHGGGGGHEGGRRQQRTRHVRISPALGDRRFWQHRAAWRPGGKGSRTGETAAAALGTFCLVVLRTALRPVAAAVVYRCRTRQPATLYCKRLTFCKGLAARVRMHACLAPAFPHSNAMRPFAPLHVSATV